MDAATVPCPVVVVAGAVHHRRVVGGRIGRDADARIGRIRRVAVTHLKNKKKEKRNVGGVKPESINELYLTAG